MSCQLLEVQCPWGQLLQAGGPTPSHRPQPGCSGPHDRRWLGGPPQDLFLSSTLRKRVGAVPQKWVSCVGLVNSTQRDTGCGGHPSGAPARSEGAEAGAETPRSCCASELGVLDERGTRPSRVPPQECVMWGRQGTGPLPPSSRGQNPCLPHLHLLVITLGRAARLARTMWPGQRGVASPSARGAGGRAVPPPRATGGAGGYMGHAGHLVVKQTAHGPPGQTGRRCLERQDARQFEPRHSRGRGP